MRPVDPARRGRVRRLRRQGTAPARGVPPWRGDRAERHPGDHRHPEEGSRRRLRQRLDTDPHPRCPRRREPALHPGLPRGHAHHPGEARHPHRDEDLAHPTALLRMEADPLRADYGGGDTVERGLRHLPGDRHLRTVPHELRPGIRGYNDDPGPGEGPSQGPLHGLRGGDARPLHDPRGGQEGPPVSGQRTGPQGRGGLVRPQGVPRRHGCARGGRRGEPAFLPGGGLLRPPRALGPATGVREPLRRRLQGQGAPGRQLRQQTITSPTANSSG